MKAKIPFIGPAYSFANMALAVQETINYYLDVGGNEQREPIALRGVPGLLSFCSVSGATRSLERFTTGAEGSIGSGNLYACCGAQFGVIDSLGVFTQLGTLNGTSGRLWMAEMRGYIIIADAPFDVLNGFAVYPSSVTTVYTYNKTTGEFQTITNATNAAFAGHNPDTFFISNLDNPTTYDASQFTAINTRYNIVIAVVVSAQRIVIFGTEYIEFYYYSGAADFPMERQEGGTIEIGCRSAGSIVNLDGTIYFLATNGRIYRINGYTPEPVSTKPIEEQLATHQIPSFADAFAYTWKGHKFYNLTIDSPTSAARTWVFDETVPIELGWSRRKTENVGYWKGFMAAEAYGNVYVGELGTGNTIWKLDADTHTEGNDALEAIRTGYYVHGDQRSFKVSDFELVFEQDADSLDTEPGVFLSYTKDGGKTFSSELERKFSDSRIIWRNNGMVHGSIAFKSRVVDRRNRDIVSATARLIPGNDR